jgi:broad specificity phosphatase PhoE
MLILVRHGQTRANARGLLLGRADPPLTDTGYLQARSLAAALPPAARIVSSPLTRARQTAAVLAEGSPDAGGVEVDQRWIEMDYGSLDCRPASDLSPECWQAWRDDPLFVPAGGESLASVGARVRDACEALAADAAQRDVVVVSHVSPIKAAVAWAMGVGDEVAWRMFLSDAAVSRIDTSGATPLLLSFNDACAAARAHSPGAPSAVTPSAHPAIHPRGGVRARLVDHEGPDPETGPRRPAAHTSEPENAT